MAIEIVELILGIIRGDLAPLWRQPVLHYRFTIEIQACIRAVWVKGYINIEFITFTAQIMSCCVKLFQVGY